MTIENNIQIFMCLQIKYACLIRIRNLENNLKQFVHCGMRIILSTEILTKRKLIHNKLRWVWYRKLKHLFFILNSVILLNYIVILILTFHRESTYDCCPIRKWCWIIVAWQFLIQIKHKLRRFSSFILESKFILQKNVIL